MSERPGGGSTETSCDPEVTQVLDFLKTYDKIQAALSWLVESSASAPMLKGAKRAQLQRLMQHLDIDTETKDDPGGYKQLADMKAEVTDRSQHPHPRVEIPDATFFGYRIEEVKSDSQQFDIPYSPETPLVGRISLFDVMEYGHTDWSEVQSRTGHLPTEIQRIATIMADPIAYHLWWAYEASGHSTDHIAVGEDWSIQNGRHRSLAAVCLGEDLVHEAGMTQWIAVELSE